MSKLSIDFETASEADLKKVGAPAYARHPSTRILMMSWAFDNEPVARWHPGEAFPARIIEHVKLRRVVRGWNVGGFEYWVWNELLAKGALRLPCLVLEQLEDTMAAAAYWGLPLSLDMAAKAAGVTIQKDADGHTLMLRMCRPRTKNPDGTAKTWWHETDPERVLRLGQYCDRDVETERAVALSIPPLPDAEQKLWVVDQRINARGVTLDLRLVRKLRALATEAAKRANVELGILTGGAVNSINATAALLGWLRANTAYPHDNLRKDTVAERLEDSGISDTERMVLEIRADNAKTSAAKLERMLDAAYVAPGGDPSHGVVNGLLQYYGAFRTGRWAGRLIQPQNMPRGTIKNIEAAIAAVLKDMPYEGIEAFFGPPMQVVSSALRGCIVAPTNTQLVVADFAQIEARVIAWLAGQMDAIRVFLSGKDIYVHTAMQIGGTEKDRQLGKVLVLACGFGMSWRKFKETAATYGLLLTDAEAESAVGSWRRVNDKIVQFWWALDGAARQVLAKGANSQPVKVGRVQLAMWQGHLLLLLPSGRTLCYRDARLEREPGGKFAITYMGINQYTRRWERQRTYGGKLAENVTQAVARDVMADALLRVEGRRGLDTVLLVHDELIAETLTTKAPQALAFLLDEMRKAPSWAQGLPVGAEGWAGERYKK